VGGVGLGGVVWGGVGGVLVYRYERGDLYPSSGGRTNLFGQARARIGKAGGCAKKRSFRSVA